MRKLFVLLGREIRSYFYSPVAYVVLTCSLFMLGFNFYSGISLLSRGPTEVTVVEAFFNTVLFWFPFVLTFPLITMRTFAEEFKMGTIEPLMTAPVRDWQVVVSKFLGALFFYVVLWIPSLAYFYIFEAVTGIPAAQSDAAYWGSYLMLLLLGMFYISLGCLASALTSNQIIAAILALAAILASFFIGLLSFLVLNMTPELRDLIGYFSAIEQMGEFSRGILDTRPFVYYGTMTVFFLTLTHQVFQSRKWKQ